MSPSLLGLLASGVLSLAAVTGCGSGRTTPGNTATGGAGVGGEGGSTAGTAGAAGTVTAGAAGEIVDSGPAVDVGSAAGAGASDASDSLPAPGDGGGFTDPGSEGDGTFPISSPFMTAPEMTDHAGIAKGQIIQFTMASNTTFNDGSRKVAVYVPANYVSGTEVPFMVAQDGVNPQNGGSFGLDDLRPLMDNMIAAGRLPMMAGIFVDPGSQRGVEYDTASDKYYQFVENELLPAALAQVQMKNIMLNLTKDPRGRGSFGGSSGGAAAFTMGWFHPESYTLILTISGSFVNLQTPGAGAYPKTLIPNSPVKPLRVFLAAGSNDLGGGQWRAANDATAMALMAKGYHYRYVTAAGAGHEDDGARRQYLPAAMEWLWRGYPIVKK
ncbi:MAG TPA: alpha/beta hydrolase-fold protein [Polyangia bacterium]|nr:alpha/beta hydrolase-fold protein [Polyangia bacterium]